MEKSTCEELPDHLIDIAKSIPLLLQKCRADSTVKKYSSSFLRWKSWVLDNALAENNIFPVKPFLLCVYLSYLATTNGTVGAINDAYYGIKWAHDIIGIQSPTDSSKLVQNVFEGAKRTLAKPIQKKRTNYCFYTTNCL